ncbi:MAG: GYD domain-containing protein [Candidatus Binataceae bacterium]
MATYVLLSSLTPEGRRTLHSDPDRMDEVNQEITDFGCEVLAQYAVLGSYDFVTVIRAADNETVAHLSVDLGSRGTVNITTLPAIEISQLRSKLKGPKQMGRPART